MNCSLEHLGQVDFDMLTHTLQMELKVHSLVYFVLSITADFICQTLAETLNNLLEGLDLKEELFSVGYTSRLVTSQLAALPQAKARRKVCFC